MKPVDMETARLILDLSGGNPDMKELGILQLEGAVALQNHLADPEVGMGYLADEVGMGKTYVAMAAVALMRYFNPVLRVLYLCPSRNVQEKWVREYEAFVRHNVKISLGRIRTRDGRLAVPIASCRNVESLIHQAASGYYADFFIGKDSFSLHLDDDEDNWRRKLDSLQQLVPAWEWQGLIDNKQQVKDQYAQVLNYILPTFDLVVIDEAHNFKHDFTSSDRNRVLSRVLGFREEGAPRVKNALLLSATPYDRNINQLRNQLRMVGKEHLLPDPEQDGNNNAIRVALKRFMVRRLNVLSVNGEKMTRNRYRREWRKGDRAEINLENDEQKLVMALVQKKVGDMLSQQNNSPSFQAGLLASFESFTQSARIDEPVRFDGEQSEKQSSDAQDRHVLGHIVDSYIDAGLGRTLPHPKMDTVVERLCHALYEESRKQIVFVRRVRSVNELKTKLDEGYNEWLNRYIQMVLVDHKTASKLMAQVYSAYQKASRDRDEDMVGGELDAPTEPEEALPAKNDTLFAWFFRGEALPEMEQLLGAWPTPDAVRTSLTAKNRVNIVLLEPNWAATLCEWLGLNLTSILRQHSRALCRYASRFHHSSVKNDVLTEYRACQAGFVSWLVRDEGHEVLEPVIAALGLPEQENTENLITHTELERQLQTVTLYTALKRYPELDRKLNLWQSRFIEALQGSQENIEKLRRLFVIHSIMMSFLLRTGHGIVDVYLARLKQGTEDLNTKSRVQWMMDLAQMLEQQRQSTAFSTFHELERLASHLELIIRNNVPEILDEPPEQYRRILSRTLNPVSPVIGASGETGDRSPQARKFRMPGYPLALVSTDVFQEGEDLHTFCDSVVHYGISASPVSLEQKSGRVDRVNSMAQRRLQSLARQPIDHEYIQITFPFVRESIEAVQIRAVCRNINGYLLSLHDFGDDGAKVDDYLKLDQSLMDRGEIPDQIMDQLYSPYDAQIVEKNEFDTAEQVEKESQAREAAIVHVMRLLEEKLQREDAAPPPISVTDHDWDAVTSSMSICLKSARASGELLLSLTRLHKPESIVLTNFQDLKEVMKNLSWCTFSRTLAIPEDGRRGGYRLFANSEMLVGDDNITHRKEVDRLFERMELVHAPQDYTADLSDEVLAHLQSINDDISIDIDRQGATRIEVDQDETGHYLRFIFTGAHQERSHRIYLYECAGRCIFLGRVTCDGYAETLPVVDVVHYTWVRNRNVDMVAFLVNPEGAIIGRAVHPLGNLQWDEFIYCAYTLAVETDTLEYQLSIRDQY